MRDLMRSTWTVWEIRGSAYVAEYLAAMHEQCGLYRSDRAGDVLELTGEADTASLMAECRALLYPSGCSS